MGSAKVGPRGLDFFSWMCYAGEVEHSNHHSASEITLGSRSGQREFNPEDLQLIRRLLAQHPDWNRQRLSFYLCQLWNWRRLDGTFNHDACRHWLRRAHQKGLICLPLTRSRPRKSPYPIGFSPPEALVVLPPFALNAVIVRPVRYDERPRWRSLMRQYHYLGFQGMVGESIGYVATVGEHWIALLGWAAAAWKCGPRERWIGWDEALKLKRLHLIANNVRFLILPGISVPHLASKILALNLKRLGSDWQNRYAHPILLVETFVDPARFAGTCYKAAGFIDLGETQGYTKHRGGYVAHGHPKRLLVRLLHPKARTQLLQPFLHFPAASRKEGMLKVDFNDLPLEGPGSLLELLARIVDPRKRRGIRHPLVLILAISIGAALSGAKSFAAIAQWGRTLTSETLAKLGSRRDSPPSENTIRRTLQMIDANAMDREIGAWLIQQKDLSGKQVCLDGKTLRGSYDGESRPIHLLSAILGAEGVVVAQRAVGEKTNEIPEAIPLLEPLPLEGAIVTGDAMHTQVKTAEYIVEEKKADYLFTVKDNQPGLRAAIESLGARLMRSFSPSRDITGKGTWTD